MPNGGYLTSTILTAAALHSSTTLSHLHQPHVISIHLTFLRRTSVGPAEIRFRELKLGSRTSNLAVSIVQYPANSEPIPPGNHSEEDHQQQKPTNKHEGTRECITGTLILSNITTESGISLPTHWRLGGSPSYSQPSVPDFDKLKKDGSDQHYSEWIDKLHPGFRKAGEHLRIFLPKKILQHKIDINITSPPSFANPSSSLASVQIDAENPSQQLQQQQQTALIDEWITFRSPDQKFTQPTLGYISDMFPQIVENLYPASTLTASFASPEKLWYPTLVLNLDIKKLLPPEGVEWLFVRVVAKSIRNGRKDLDVTILDQDGGLVATSQHVALVMGSERNTAGRGKL